MTTGKVGAGVGADVNTGMGFLHSNAVWWKHVWYAGTKQKPGWHLFRLRSCWFVGVVAVVVDDDVIDVGVCSASPTDDCRERMAMMNRRNIADVDVAVIVPMM